MAKARGLGDRRFPPQPSALPGRQFPQESRARGARGGDRAREEEHSRAARARVAPRAGGGHRSDPWNEASEVSRGERARGRHPAHARRSGSRRRGRADRWDGRNPQSGGRDAVGQRMKLSLDGGYYVSDIARSDKAAYIEHLQEKEIYDRTLAIPYPYTEEAADWWI